MSKTHALLAWTLHCSLNVMRCTVEEAFMLKADISKAFDTVAWAFVYKALIMVNVSPRLIRIIQACMASSRVTVLVNGSGQGFIKPTRGLRQGCPLSPYIFIWAMEFLSKQLQLHLERGAIKGIKLATTAPQLTRVFYADDLMIMGKATLQEAQQMLSILNEFALASGLQVNPQKSTMWFSRCCSDNCRQQLFLAFGAREAEINEKYLGIVVSQSNRQHDITHELLMDKLYSKLAR